MQMESPDTFNPWNLLMRVHTTLIQLGMPAQDFCVNYHPVNWQLFPGMALCIRISGL